MTWYGETIAAKDRNPDTLASQLANFAAMAMAHDVRVELRLRGGGRRVGRIVRRDVQPELFEPDPVVRWAKADDDKAPRHVSSVLLYLDDGGDPLPLNDVSDIRSLNR
jgi:hypothetical protein